MNKWFAAVLVAAVALGSVAMAMTQAPERADDAVVTAKIDARLHQLLLKTAHR